MQDAWFDHRLRRREMLRAHRRRNQRVRAAGAPRRPTALAAAPATSPGRAQAGPDDTNQLNIAWNAAPPNLNPLNAVSQAQWTHSRRRTPPCACPIRRTRHTRPTWRSRGTSRPDGSSYTFHLRDNAKWHDGTPVTAATSSTRTRWPSTPTPPATWPGSSGPSRAPPTTPPARRTTSRASPYWTTTPFGSTWRRPMASS